MRCVAFTRTLREFLSLFSCKDPDKVLYFRKEYIINDKGDFGLIRNSKNNTESTDNAHGIKLRHIFFCLLMILALLSLVSYSPQDWNALNGGIAVPPANWIGSLGARFSYFLLISLGFAGYVAVLLLLLRSIRMFFSGSGSIKSFLTGMYWLLAERCCFLLFLLKHLPLLPVRLV